MNIKKFYLETMFSGYTEKMPEWLAFYAKQEVDHLNKILEEKIRIINVNSFISKEIKVLDVGCGDCRIYKQLPEHIKKDISYTCTDIFSRKELPIKFKNWLKKENITYIPLFELNKLYCVPYYTKDVDIIVSLGVDAHCSLTQIRIYFSAFKDLIHRDGTLVWQKQRTDNWQGLRLLEEDRDLNYETNPLDFYSPWENIEINPLSYFILYSKKELERFK